MTFLADARYRPKDRPNRRPRLPFRDSYSPDEPRNKYGQWEGNAGVIGLTNAASTIRRFTQKNPAGVRFVIGQNGDVGYGSSYGATHSQISEETGIGHAAIHGWMSTAGEDKRFVAWHNSPEGIKAGVENDETLPTEAHPFLGSLEQQGLRNAKLGESGYFDAVALLDALFDAAPSRDPTGTSDLRRDFERELKDRWQRLDRCLNKAVGISDALGLSPIGVLSLIPAADRMKHFRSWLDELLSHLIVSGGGWMQTYLDEAGSRASSRAAGLDPRKAAGGGLPTAPRIAGYDAATDDEPRDERGRWTAGGESDRLARAKEQGFDTTTKWFHGSSADFGAFRENAGTWLTTDPEVASDYSELTARYSGAAQVYPLHIRGKLASQVDYDKAEKRGKSTADTFAELRRQGFDGYRDGKIAVIFEPKNIRSQYAEFHPDKVDSSGLSDSATEDAILVLATSELQGICDAFSQQATRLAAHCVLTRARPQRAAQGIRQLIATVGLQRSRMMADYLVTKAHACATLEAFREAGVTHVGTVAEMVPHVHVGDAGPEDEPRDKLGQWTSGASDVRLFHGTTEAAAAAIKEQGLKPLAGPGADEWARRARMPVQDFQVGDRKISVFVTDNIDVAHMYADKATALTPFKSGIRGAILTIDIPAEFAHNLKRDEMSNGTFGGKAEYSFRYVGDIPPEWIRPRHIVIGDSKSTGKTIYLVVNGVSDALDDAARKTPQHQHPITGKFITKTAATREWGRRASGKFGTAPKTYNRSLKHRKALRGLRKSGEEEVNIQTAGDDRVCQACQNVAAAGPYPINEAMDLIPLHPNCRCVFIPADEGGSNRT